MRSIAPSEKPDPRSVLARVGHRKVCRIAREDSPEAEALFAVAARGRTAWTLAEWEAVLAELDKTTVSVDSYLQSEDWLRIGG